MAELTTTGLAIRRFPEIQEQLRQAILQNVSSSIVFDEDTIFSQLTDIISLEISNLEQALQSVYDSLDRDKAEGASLDSLMNLIGLQRIPAARTSGNVTFFGNDSTSIPVGTILENPSTSDRFQTTVESELRQASCASCSYTVANVLSNNVYTVTINNIDVSYTSGGAATSNEIVTGLATVINAQANRTWEASTDVSPARLIISTLDSNNISCAVTSALIPGQLSVNVNVEAQEFGRIIAPASSVTQVVTAIGGIDRITNPNDLGVGRLRETDGDFRIRAASSLSLSGSATVPALRAAILNIPEVTNVSVEENVSGTVVEGRPPHSFEVIVTAPDTAELNTTIATAIWNDKPAGIQTYGNTVITIQDSTGRNRDVSFSRPTGQVIAMRVTYSRYDEESFPTNGQSQIQQAVVNYGSTLSPSEDVIVGRFFGSIYQVPGISGLSVESQELASSGDTPDPTSWTTNPISISDNESATFNSRDVYVVEQP